MKKLFQVSALAVLLAGCASAPKTTNLSESTAALAARHVKTEKLETLPNKRIAIASFGVEFQTRLLHGSSTFGSTSSTTTLLNLQGVSPATMQAVADEAYRELVADLQAAGYEVVPQQTLQASALYQGIVSDAKPTPLAISFENPGSKSFKNSEATVYSAAGARYYPPVTGEAGARLSTAGKAFGDAFSNIGRGFAGKAPVPDAETALAKELNASLLKVYYVVGFGKASGSVGSGWHNSKASTGINIVGGGETRFALRTPDGSNFHMQFGKNPPPVDGNAFVRLEESVNAGLPFLAGDVYDSTSTANRVGNVLSQTLAVAGALSGMGAIGTASTTEFTAPADDALYRQSVSRQLSAVEDMLVYRLAQGK